MTFRRASLRASRTLHELFYVLTRHFRWSRQDTAEYLLLILSAPRARTVQQSEALERDRRVRRALDAYPLQQCPPYNLSQTQTQDVLGCTRHFGRL